MRIAVTGADGFVGPHLVAYLRAARDEVLALRGPAPHPRPANGSASRAPASDARVGKDVSATAIDGPCVDVLDEVGLRAVLARFDPDAVVHLAGMSSVSQSHAHPVEALRVNLLGTTNVCVALRETAKRARLLLVGSGEMYGPVAPGRRAREDSPMAPTSPYAASKVGAEVAALMFHRAYGLDVVCARPFNHIGAGQRRDFSVPSFARQIEAIRDGRVPPVLSVGNLDPVRDFSHVSDVVAAYGLLLERGASGEAYNVCSGEGRTIRSLLEELIQVAGVTARIEVDPARVRPVDIPSLVGDAAKLHALGWRPHRGVGDALQEVLAEARAHGPSA